MGRLYSTSADTGSLLRRQIALFSAALLVGINFTPGIHAAGPACAPVPQGLVGWWKAEDTPQDELGAHDGTTPFGIAYAEGLVGEAFDFDGSWRRVSVPDSPQFKLTNAMTLEAWVYPRAYQGFITFRGDNRGGLDTWTLDAYQPGLVNFQIDDPSNNYASVQAPLQLNQWQHVAATWDRASGDMKLYINGTLAAQTNTTIIPIGDLDANGAVGIGNHGGTFHQFPFNGLVDELGIYGRALTPTEIASIYNAGAAGKCLTQPPQSPSTNWLVNVDFVPWVDGTTKVGPAATGERTNDFWNFYTRDDGTGGYRTFGGATNLLRADGTPTRVGMTVANAPGAWRDGSADPMYETYLYPFDDGVVTVTVTNLPAGVYDFYAYSFDGNCELLVGGASQGVEQCRESPIVNPPVWQEGTQYVLFEQVNVGSGQDVELIVRKGVDNLAVISGMQIKGSIGAPPAPCVPLEGVVSWWRAEGDARDSIGDNDGVLLNGATFAAGEVGQAFSFDGVDDAVSFGNTAGNFASNDFTIEFWVKTTSAAPVQSLLSKRAVCDYASFFDIRLGTAVPGTQGVVFAALTQDASGANRDVMQSSTRVNDGLFHHVALVRHATSAMLYVDGALEDSNSTSGITFISNTAELMAGRSPCVGSDGTRYFDGELDELTLYARALTPTEIASIYNAGSAGKCTPTPPSVGPVITNLTPTSGTKGTAIVIEGANFSTMPEKNIVRFGAVQALVAAATSSSLSVLVPPGATYGPVTVTANGLTAYSPEFFLPVSAGSGSPLKASSFSPGMNVPAAAGPIRVVISDLDNDGRPDLAAGNFYDHTLSVYRNLEGSGSLSPTSFAPRFELPTGVGPYNPYWIVAADLDGDGRPDLVSTDLSNSRVGIHRNQSEAGDLSPASFGPLIEFPVGGSPQRLTVFDLNGDGRPEIITANTSGSVSILPNQGPSLQLNGSSFGPAVNLSTAPNTQGIAVGDLDGDGLPDLVVAAPDVAYLSVFRNLGTPGPITPSTFAPAVQVPVPSQSIMVSIADVDGDGKPDLITGSYLGHTMSVLRNISTPRGLASGWFAPYVSFALTGRAHNVGLGDLNGNGILDIAMATELDSAISVFENLSAPGGFGTDSLAPPILLPTGWNAWGVSVGDLDLDGRPDIVFGNQYDNTLTLYRNQVPVGRAPVISSQPQGGSFNEGDMVVLNVKADGDPTVDYQWWKDGSALSGATNETLEFKPVHFADRGTYFVVVSNAFDTVTSSNAVLDVNRLPLADASATLPLVISPNNTNAAVVLNGTLSSDPDGDPLTYSWYSTLSPRRPTLLATGVVAVVTLPVGINPIKLVVDDGMASDTNSITVEVITPTEAAEKLLAAATDSDAGHGQSLIASLSAALASIDRSQPIAAINQLQAFQNQVLAQVAPEDPALAADFIQQAQDIIDSLAQGDLGAKNLKVMAGQEPGNMRLEFSGSAGTIYIIEASNDMVHWRMIGVAKSQGNGKFNFKDPNADNLPARFYRVVMP